MAPRFSVLEQMERAFGDFASPSPIDDSLLAAIRSVESGGNDMAVSHAGAKGPYQLMDPVGLTLHKRLGLTEEYNPFSPKQSEVLARELLREEFERFGSEPLVLAAYNAGSPAVNRAIEQAGGVRDFNAIAQYLPQETREYVPKVLKKKNTSGVSSGFGVEPVQPVEPQRSVLEEMELEFGGDLSERSKQSSEPSDNRGFFQRNIAGPLSAVGNTITLGGVDELAGALGGGVDVVADKLQRYLKGEYTPFFEIGDREKGIFKKAYGDTRDVGRETLAGFRKDNPVLSPTLEVTAGLLTPAAKAKTLLGMTGLGGLQGFLYGFNDAEGGLGERAKGGAVGGTIGTGAAGLLGALAKGGAKVLQSTPFASRLGRLFEEVPERAGELGSVATSGGADDKISRDIVRGLLKVTSETDAADLQKAKQALGRDDLYNLIDALDDPRTYAEGRYFRQAPGGVSVADNFLDARNANITTRTNAALRRISPEADPGLGSAKLIKGAQKVVRDAEKARAAKTTPLYQAAKEANPTIDTDGVKLALESDEVQSIINTYRKNFPQKYKDLPDNHYDLLDVAKKALDDKASQAFRENNKYMGGLYADLSKILAEGIDAADGYYAKAGEVHKKLSPMVDRLKGNKAFGVRGILRDLLDPTAGDATSGARNLFKLTPREIRQVKDAFGDKYAEEFDAGVRAYLQQQVNRLGTGLDDNKARDVASYLVKNKELKDQLKAALGADDTDSLMRALRRELQFIKTHQKTFSGSVTSANVAKEKEWGSTARKLMHYANPANVVGDAVDVIAKAIQPDRQDFNKQIAEALFVPGRSRDVIDELLKARYGFDKYRAATDRAAAGTTAAITQGLVQRGID